MRLRGRFQQARTSCAVALARMEASFSRHGAGVLDALAARRRFWLAVALVLVAFLPTLLSRGENAGFLFGGDSTGYYLPALAKTHALLHGLNFTALDFSAYNGSSDFFLAPNFFPLHPGVVVYSLLVPPAAWPVDQIGTLVVGLVVLHLFAALYFTMRLGTRYLGLSLGQSAFAAVAFGFSVYVVNALFTPAFVFTATMIPVMACTALEFAAGRTLGWAFGAAFSVVVTIMAGYLPMSVACMAVAVLLVTIRLLVLEPLVPMPDRLGALFRAALPFVLALVVTAPYVLSLLLFHMETPAAGSPSLFFSAHQLAEQPHGILRLFSNRARVPGPFVEFTVWWGMPAVAIVAVFLFCRECQRMLDAFELRLMLACAAAYALAVLAIYGDYSVVSDLLYYLVPPLGRMHIYQRFLLPMQLPFAIVLAIMLKGIVLARPVVGLRIALGVTVALAIAAAVVSTNPTLAHALAISEFMVLELIFTALLLAALLMPVAGFAVGAAVLLQALAPLDQLYDVQQPRLGYKASAAKQPLALDRTEQQRIVDFLKRNAPGREVIKYVDVSPMWGPQSVESFPKAFPYYVLQDVRLSSSAGFTFYLSGRADYMKRLTMTTEVAITPDWDLLRASGADFIVGRRSDLASGPGGDALRAAGDRILALPNDIVVVPLAQQARPEVAAGVLDNGFFRVQPTGGVRPATDANVARGKPVRLSRPGVGAAERAVDGNTEGDYAKGSVAESGPDPDAWLEVDLGASMAIGRIRVWPRTDCCDHRLTNVWVMVSEQPFGEGGAEELRKAKGTWSAFRTRPAPLLDIDAGSVRGRYVRVQFDGKPGRPDAHLPVAELEVFPPVQAGSVTVRKHAFSTDFASTARLEFETSGPATVQYLFWDNPRLAYSVDGRRVAMNRLDLYPAIDVPAGRHVIEVRYAHWPLRIFWLFYTLFAIACLVVLAGAARAAWRARRVRRAQTGAT